MRTSVARATRGVLAGVACLSFVALFFLGQAGGGSLTVFAVLAVVGIGCLAAAAGPSAVLQLVGVRSVDSDAVGPNAADSDWWLVRLEPVLEDAWNRWSDAVLVLGLGVIGVGSLVLLAVHPADEPPLALLIVGFLGVNGALICLAAALR